VGKIVYFAWNGLLLVATTLIWAQAPFQVTLMFVHGTGRVNPGLVWRADDIITLLFVADMFVNLRTPVIDHGRLVQDRRELVRRYLSGAFAYDLIAAFPYHLALMAFGAQNTPLGGLLPLARLAKLPRILTWFRQNSSLRSSVLRLATFVYMMALTSHAIACGWYALTVDPAAVDTVSNYVTSLYWTTTTLTTIGYGDITPDLNSNVQKLYAMCVMILGVGVYGYVIGNVASLFANLDRAKSQHEERLGAFRDFMMSHRVPAELQARVMAYFSYVWQVNHGYHYQSMLADLPETLQHDFALFLNRDILRKVPLFEGTDEHAVRDIARALQPCYFLPNDRVVRRGELGSRMYFIRTGSLDVLGAQGEVLSTLGEGAFFGEISLLEARPRTADVVARDFCELYSLDKTAFEAIMERHEAFRRNIRGRTSAMLDAARDSPADSAAPPDEAPPGS